MLELVVCLPPMITRQIGTHQLYYRLIDFEKFDDLKTTGYTTQLELHLYLLKYHKIQTFVQTIRESVIIKKLLAFSPRQP